jgi:predicted nucleotidyltransferase
VQEILRNFFDERPEVALAYLFGSYVQRTKGQFHDIDIAVLLLPQNMTALDQGFPYGYAADLSSNLGRILKYDPIDIVLLNRASPLMLRHVIGKGKLVYCRSEADRIRFEVTSLQRHADTAHIRKIKRLYMNQRIERGLAAYA